MDWEKDMGRFNGITEKYLKANGKMGLRMVLEHGNHQKVIFMKVNGYLIDSMAKGHLNID